MKIFKYIALCGLLTLGLTSCEDWLDVNVDQDKPNNKSILIQHRAPWLQRQYAYAAGVGNVRTFAIVGGLYSKNTNMNSVNVTWAAAAGLTTTPYQMWLVSGAANIGDLYDRAEKEGAYHYMALANVIYAMGFMEMGDLYGEFPFTEALGESVAPKYDYGNVIYNGCMKKLDDAIELFSRDQRAGCTPLSAGDIWNGGDVQKWIKLCYGLKARWLLKLSKKADKFDPDAILAALDKAPKSNAEATVVTCFDTPGMQTGYVDADPVSTNYNWNYAAYSKDQWTSKYYYDLLTNMRGAGVEDPRFTKIVPASMTNVQVDASGKVVKWDWRRSEGIDIYGDAERLVAGGAASISVQSFATDDKEITYTIKDATAKAKFVNDFKAMGYTETTAAEVKAREIKVGDNAVTVVYPKGAFYVNSTNYVLAGDTIYVNLNAGSPNTNNGSWGMAANDFYYHTNDKAAAVAGAVSGTGSFQTRSISDYDVVSYYEMCFIKAEVLFRKGHKAEAHAAYVEGIKANIERMQTKLKEWQGQGYDNPDMMPMDDAQIAAYLASPAIATSANLTMSDIMLQKYVAMGFSMENYNDMRRFNFSAGNIENFGVVYPGYGRTKLFAGASQVPGTVPTDPTYWIRRWRLPDKLELQYNATNADAINASAHEPNVWSLPVWWDCATDEEYFNYLK